jgi:hypothetical protein
MVPELQKLSEAQAELVIKAPFLVCILIAGADGKIDKKEIKEAINIAQNKHKKASQMQAFFKELATDFEDKLKILIQSYPYESTQRNPLIVAELAELNQCFSLLPFAFATEYYALLKDIAQGIASSSGGGLMGLGESIAPEEAKYLHLPMIKNPG